MQNRLVASVSQKKSLVTTDIVLLATLLLLLLFATDRLVLISQHNNNQEDFLECIQKIISTNVVWPIDNKIAGEKCEFKAI